MNNLEDLKTIGVLIGISLQVIGLAFVIYQLKKLNTSIRISAQSALYQQSSTVRAIIVEHPNLRKYFFEKEEISSDSEHYDRVKTIAEMFLNYLEHLVIQQGSLRAGDLAAWHRFVSRTINASPIMQNLLKEKPEFYSDDLLRLYDIGQTKMT
ncbi:hypothetical protein [Arsukibacterium sp.]|uniref:hypothetical protein n=1 Tax=Arsukibacterium sp. TaxID=1977258 RepID=UPI00299E83FB|nr:hypothetical protein [Arsukibacterium sp.]MDX1539172.1 hypothetical protein [Arsukibacterium sp.]